jgi:hypothetical protein
MFATPLATFHTFTRKVPSSDCLVPSAVRSGSVSACKFPVIGELTGKSSFFLLFSGADCRLNPAEIQGFSVKFPEKRTGNSDCDNREYV